MGIIISYTEIRHVRLEAATNSTNSTNWFLGLVELAEFVAAFCNVSNGGWGFQAI
jgi:hypothetical protein